VSRPSDAVALSLSQEYLQAAPAALIPLIVTRSLSAAAATGTSVSLLADATAKTIAWAHAKLVAGACAACLLVTAAGTVVAIKSPLLARADAPASSVVGPIASPATAAVASAPPSDASRVQSPVPASKPSSTDVLLLPNAS